MIDSADSVSFVVLAVMGYRLVDGVRHARTTNGRSLELRFKHLNHSAHVERVFLLDQRPGM